VNHHPCANNILASSSNDFTVKIWDIEKAEDMFTIGGHTDIVQSCSWNKDGSFIVSACRDKKLRIIDPRNQTVSGDFTCHQGVKGLRVLWMADKDKLLSTGFTKTMEREYAIWDPRSFAEPLARQVLDTQSGVVMPFYDPDSSILFLAGKGDGNVRFYEIVDDKPFSYYISAHNSNVPQRGMCMLPKRAVNVSQCEVVRMLKAENSRVEPISFIVPRKSDLYQNDLYPNCFSGTPSITAEEWKAGGNVLPDCSFCLAPGISSSAGSAARPTDFKPVVKEEKPKEEKPKTEKEVREENEALKLRISYLEAELVKKR
jgi:coronin-1B/1C/6